MGFLIPFPARGSVTSDFMPAHFQQRFGVLLSSSFIISSSQFPFKFFTFYTCYLRYSTHSSPGERTLMLAVVFFLIINESINPYLCDLFTAMLFFYFSHLSTQHLPFPFKSFKSLVSLLNKK